MSARHPSLDYGQMSGNRHTYPARVAGESNTKPIIAKTCAMQLLSLIVLLIFYLVNDPNLKTAPDEGSSAQC